MIIRSIIKKIVQKISPHTKFLVQLDITNACNLKCIHCYHPHHNNSDAINLRKWNLILDQIKILTDQLYVEPEFTFCGGEPLVSQNLKPLIDKINTIWQKPRIVILTNGTILSEKHLQFLDPQQIRFQVSLDGPTKELHDAVRGNGNFEKSIKGIELLIKKAYDVSCLSVLSNNNVNHIESFFQLAQILKVKSMNFERFVTQGEGQKLFNIGKDTPLEGLPLKVALEKILYNSLKYNVETNTNTPLYCLIDKTLGHHNMVATNGIVIDYKGNLRVTSRTDYIIGNILETGLPKLYFDDKLLKKLRNGDIEECGSCKFYTRCGGSRNASYAKYKNFLKKDPGCWYKEGNQGEPI